MSKDFLLEQIKALVPNEYSIELYFLKIDKRNQNPYFVFKHTFKNSNYLPDYINALRDTIIKYQIQPIEYVQRNMMVRIVKHPVINFQSIVN